MGTGTHCEEEGGGVGGGGGKAEVANHLSPSHWLPLCVSSSPLPLLPPGTSPVPRLPSFSRTLETPYSTKDIVLGVRPYKHIMSVTFRCAEIQHKV